MTRNTRSRNYIVLLFIALLCGALLRFVLIDRIPGGIGADELSYILTAKFIAVTGSDASGTWNPLSVFAFRYPSQFPQAEMLYSLLTPILAVFPLSLITVKIFFALISLATIAVLSEIAFTLFGSEVAGITAFVAAMNPWSVFLGRTAYEMNIEVFFYLLAFLLLLRLKSQKILLAIPVFFAAFYSHIASKTIFWCYTGVCCVIAYIHQAKAYWKQLVCVFLASVAITCFFILTILSAPGSRTSELIRPADPLIANTVNTIRKHSLASPFDAVFTNKISVMSTLLISKLLATISPSYLFLNGDEFFGLRTHGLFYVIDAIFLVLGIVLLFVSGTGISIGIVLLLFISLIPHLLHTWTPDNFTPQISLFFPFAFLCISYGIRYVWSLPKRFRGTLRIGIVLVYMVSLGNFIHVYFFQYPLLEALDFKSRVLSRYVELSTSSRIAIYTPGPKDVFDKYLFYSNGVTTSTIPTIREAYRTGNYLVGNVYIADCTSGFQTADVHIVDESCKQLLQGKETKSITRLSDAGTTYRIAGDQACENTAKTSFATNISLSDFAVENLTRERFCRQYVR